MSRSEKCHIAAKAQWKALKEDEGKYKEQCRRISEGTSRSMRRIGKFINLKGKTFGGLKVIKYNRKGKHKGKWKCRCICGTIVWVYSSVLRTKKGVQSCGCIPRPRKPISHGLSKHSLYHVWVSMKARCNNPNQQVYADYGGRGITVCKRWQTDFLNFYNWAIKHGYKRGLYLDRIDNESRYSPENCRWVTPRQSVFNRRPYHPSFKLEQECVIAVDGV